ncbi:MATE family efflux transporter [Phytohabitans sp. LJ34]|uniref:MATE family efflux transporter n=1 Tax=Phytohabitans sp. LJ34 TaxID=3452217 RepID=UPI003F8B7AA0
MESSRGGGSTTSDTDPAGPAARGDHAAALGTEPVGRLLWQACTQTTMAVGVYGIYALTNAWFVARGVGAVAFAAVNLVAPVLLILGAVATTVGAGGASLVSRSLGRGDPRTAARAAGNAFVVFWATALTVSVAGVLLLDPLLDLLGATGQTHAYAREYGLIILAGAITATGFSSLVRAEGRMRFSTLLWVVAVLTQIILDPILIFGFDLGVRGAALGTVGGQAVGLVLSLWFFFALPGRPYRIRLADLRPHGPTMRQVVTLGAPSFLAGFGATVLVAVANNLLAGSGGAVALAAFALCARVGTFVAMPQLGIAQGLQPVVGYNAGLGATGRVARATTLTLRATVGYGTVVCGLVVVLAGPLTALFTNDAAVHEQAVTALRVLALAYPLAGVAPLISARFQALGQPRASYLISVGTLIAIKIPFLVAFSRYGQSALWWSFPAAELAVAAVALLILRRRPFS